MIKYKQIISSAMAFVICFLLVVPVGAVDIASSPKNWWDNYILMGVQNANAIPIVGHLISFIQSAASGEVCGLSADGLHHASSADGTGGTTVDGKPFLYAKCKFCSSVFKAYGADLSTAYNDYVTGLPADNINSQGLSNFYITGWTYSFPSETSEVVSERTDALGFECISGPATSGYLRVGALSGTFTVPTDGTYRIVVPSARVSEKFSVGSLGLFSIVDGVHTRVALKNVHNSTTSSSGSSLYVTSVSSSEYYFVDVVLSKSVSYCLSSVDDNYSTVLCDRDLAFIHNGAYQTLKLLTTPYIQGMNLVSTAPIGSYVANTRTGSLAGNFGYYGDDGKMIAAENVHIVNETDNSVFNPVTNTTTNFTDWQYDYSTRSYTLTLDTGDKQTITYGDEYVTIKEGDTIYNVYYVTDGSTTPPVACVHEYTSSVTTAATCTVPGVRTSTCSKCANVITETISAVGHKWVVKETVNTSYGADGKLLVEGYTIYKCSICNEEYKDALGGGPPPGGGDSGDSVFSGVFGILFDFLGFFFGSLKDLTTTGIGAFLKSLQDSTSDIFGLLNPLNWFN